MRRIALLTLVFGLAAPIWLEADTLHVAADAYTNTAEPTTRYGRRSSLVVRRGATGAVMNGFLRFDLTPVPADATLQKALLRLYVLGVVVPGTVEVVPVVAPWQERTISAKNSPLLGDTAVAFDVESSDVGQFITVDVTELFQEWVSGDLENNGLALRGTEDGAVNVSVDAKESVRTSHAPELEVVWAGSGGTVTAVTAGAGLTGGTITTSGTLAVDDTAVQSRVTGTCSIGSSIRTVNQDGSVACELDDNTPGWGLTGNAGTNPATNFIGTTDVQPLELRVNNGRVWRVERANSGHGYEGPNVIGGSPLNTIRGNLQQVTIAGGGGMQFGTAGGHLVTDVGGTIGGGHHNQAGSDDGNIEIGRFATVAGGEDNTASGSFSAIPGGELNSAGGNYSFAAGRRAKVRTAAQTGEFGGDDGTFVWNDAASPDFQSTGPNQFLIRAGGGVAINTNTPVAGAALTVNGHASLSGNIIGSLSFGATTRQMINLWNTVYGIGVQAFTHYLRTDNSFAWYMGGVHSDTANDPGAGGTRQMTLDANGNLRVRGAVTGGGADFAEMLPAERGLEPGDVLAIGPDGSLVKSSEAYQTSVAGVFSTQPAFLGGAADGEDLAGKVPLAVVGIVPVKASAENGAIRPGDRLVASATPGHAMRATDAGAGTVIGKALAALETGTGMVRMLVALQ